MKFTLTLLNFYMTFIFSGYRLSLTPVVEILLPEKARFFLFSETEMLCLTYQ